jgi:hypothetical protein
VEATGCEAGFFSSDFVEFTSLAFSSFLTFLIVAATPVIVTIPRVNPSNLTQSFMASSPLDSHKGQLRRFSSQKTAGKSRKLAASVK